MIVRNNFRCCRGDLMASYEKPMKRIRVKIVLIGDGGVGKTSIAKRYLGESFEHEYKRTIGADFYVKRNVYEDPDLGKIMFEWLIWDLAGQPAYNEVRPLYYRGAQGALLVFDVTRPETYYNLPKWLSEYWKHCGAVLPFVLVGNKIDIRDSSPNPVPPEAGKEYAKITSKTVGVQIPYIETSAKTGENINEAFNFLANVILSYTKLKLQKK